MPVRQFVHSTTLPFPAGEVFRWHEQAGALERLSPPWQDVRVEARQGGIADGGRVTLSMKTPLGRRRWVAEHRDLVRGQWFRDVQVTGPFKSFEHLHRMDPDGEHGCTMTDRIDYELPLGALGDLAAGWMVRRDLRRAFAYRHSVLAEDLRLLDACGRVAPKRILVTGASGLVGTALVPLLRTAGHEIVTAVRRTPSGVHEIQWEPEKGRLAAGDLDGFDAVVHLAGENIAGGRWTAARKARMKASRVDGTTLLANQLTSLKNPPSVLVSASAIGFYGERGEEALDESSPAGTGFLPEVCAPWEAATAAATDRGIRVVLPRIGVVLSPQGGALAKMLRPFGMGVGGVVGSGRQYMSWITLDDLIGVLFRAVHDDRMRGPVNAVAPEPVSNLTFTKTLGHVLARPTVAPLPAPMVSLLFGEMGRELLLSSTRVLPARLDELGHDFRHTHLEAGLRHVLGRTEV